MSTKSKSKRSEDHPVLANPTSGRVEVMVAGEDGLVGPGPMPSILPLYKDWADFQPHPSDAEPDGSEPTLDPHIDSLVPDTSVVGVEVTIHVHGHNFAPDAVVEADQAPLPTVYVSASELTVTGTPIVDGASEVTVRNVAFATESNSVTYTVTTA